MHGIEDAAADAMPPAPAPFSTPASVAVRECRLSSDKSSPGVARRWVAAQLGALGLLRNDATGASGGLYDVLLCTSELVNASLIADSTAMTLRLDVRPGTIGLSLLDDCDFTHDGSDGRMRAQLLGLYIFDSVTRGWGVDPVPGGRLLWAELDLG